MTERSKVSLKYRVESADIRRICERSRRLVSSSRQGALGLPALFVVLVMVFSTLVPPTPQAIATVEHPESASAGVFFQDDFESGDLSHEENGARWGSDRQARVLTENPKTGNYSLRFFYPGTTPEKDSFAELRFHLAPNRYSELWIRYDLYVPANFYHRDAPGSDNNKFLALWSGAHPRGFTGPALVPNYWPRPSGESHLILFAGGPQNPDGSGQMFRKNYWDEGGQIFEVADRGKWLTIIVHAKYATPANDDGIFRLWKIRDGVTIPVLDKTDGAWYVPGQPGFDGGYLMGWANAGFAQDTSFFLDNIKFSTTSLLKAPGSGAPPVAPGSGTFVDDDASMFEPYIERIVAAGITRGCSEAPNARFCPERPVTRGQMAAFLVRALDLTDRGTLRFSDDDGSFFEPYIEKLATAGITRGCSAGPGARFCPEYGVTRAQMAAFVVRALGLTDRGSIRFVDDNGSEFEADIEKLATAGITLGCSTGPDPKFCPDDIVARGEMAAFLTRAFGL